MSRNTLFGILGAVVIGVLIYAIVDEQNESPFEEAAESVEDAADEIADELD